MSKGFSILLAIGKYGGFHMICRHSALRFCLGWIAITFYLYDYEEAIEALAMDHEELSKQLNKGG